MSVLKNEYPPNFSRSEMLVSNTATRHGISNEPETPEIEQNIIKMAWVLQALRDKLTEARGKATPIRVLSVYRSPKVNKLVGGSKTSAHMKGLAADIQVPSMGLRELAEFVREHVKSFDQIILEFPPGGWVHVGLAQNPRGQLLTAMKVSGKTVYKTGFA